MSAKTTIVLTDVTPVTPVARSFYPLPPQKNGILSWIDRTIAILKGQNRLTLEQRESTRKAPALKVAWKLETPVLEQTSASTSTGIQPAPTLAYSLLFNMEFILPDRSTLQERKDLLAMARDLIDEAIVGQQVEDGNLIY
jgi:hypothetical protein